MKKVYLLQVFFFLVLSGNAQTKTENVVVITLDGLRWQELFAGADSQLINDDTYVHNARELKKKFWANEPSERRMKFMPFMWGTIAKQGQIYGNRWMGNKVNNANPYWFSYPGYNEIFTGFPDDSVNSNDKRLNKNENVLEYLHRQKDFKGKIAAFTSWDCFDAILNEPRSGFLVSSGFDKTGLNTPEFRMLDEAQFLSPQPLGDGVRPDFLTYTFAKKYLETFKPRLLYIGFDETDDYAHSGKYDEYLYSGYMTDKWIGDIWNYLQSQPQYKDKTTLLITTDHGRGDKEKKQWTSHGEKVPDASEIWFAAIGPDTRPLGEMKEEGQWYQRQVATTIAAVLGYDFKPKHPVMEPFRSVLAK
ncbi:MAG: alkaline phosphatase family protein [Chitinophagaceae bacterium]|nr:alkaline phosphatase family protein [Chitinophagaceae bacterium]MBN8666869.1 alkaline phosphatase family protein [Chitinophagales bacterium]